MKRAAKTNINTSAYWDEVYASEDAEKQRVDSVRLGQLERWVRVREEEASRTARVLDASCGRGDVLAHLWNIDPRRLLVGVDLSSVAIEQAKAWRYSQGAHDVDFRVGDVLALDQAFTEHETFDVVWCGETLEHLDYPADAIAQCAHRVGDDGLLVLSTPFKQRNVSDEHVWEFEPADVTRWASEVGELLFLDCLLLPSFLTMFAVIRKGTHS